MKNIFERAAVAFPAQNVLGESPVWNEERDALIWVDIDAGTLHELRWPEKKLRSWKMPQSPGMVALLEGGKVVAALREGLMCLDTDTGGSSWLLDLEKPVIHNRANDGKCDARGRLWLGTMHVNCVEAKGTLYMIDEKLAVSEKIHNLTVSNGITWSNDNKRMYFIDSATYRIDAYLFDVEKGDITFEKTVVNVPHDLGMPDGMTIDAEGMLWVAHWNGFAIRRWNPITGDQIGVIKVPAPQVTSVTFGGKNLDELFITTAWTGMSREALEAYPLSGDLFHIKLDVRGLPANRCRIRASFTG